MLHDFQTGWGMQSPQAVRFLGHHNQLAAVPCGSWLTVPADVHCVPGKIVWGMQLEGKLPLISSMFHFTPAVSTLLP